MNSFLLQDRLKLQQLLFVYESHEPFRPMCLLCNSSLQLYSDIEEHLWKLTLLEQYLVPGAQYRAQRW